MLRRKTIAAWLILSASLSACTVAGDFCDVAEPIRLDRDLAQALVETDRATAVKIGAHNQYGQNVCGW